MSIILQILYVSVYTWKGGMERPNGLSFATQQISVKSGTRLLAIPPLTPTLSPEFTWTCAQSPTLWVLFAPCRTLSALLPTTGYVARGDTLFGLLCSVVSAAWWNACSRYFSLHSGMHQHALPGSAGRCAGTDFYEAGAGVLLCQLWAKWGSTFYSCLTFQSFQWKISKGLTVR